MSDATTTKAPRPINPGTHKVLPALTIEVFLGGDSLGSIGVAQEEKLSQKGNVLYRGAITKGWQLPEFPGGPEATLAALGFSVNGQMAKPSEKGVHPTAPRKDKAGKDIPGTGGELFVAHTALLDVSTDPESAAPYMVNVFAHKRDPKQGKEQHYSLRIQGIPQAIGVAGPQVIGEVSGLLIVGAS